MLCRPITFRQSTKQREINWTIRNGARARVSSFSRHIVWRLKLTCEWRNQQIFNKSLVFHYRFTGRWNKYNTCKQSYQLILWVCLWFFSNSLQKIEKEKHKLNWIIWGRTCSSQCPLFAYYFISFRELHLIVANGIFIRLIHLPCYCHWALR